MPLALSSAAAALVLGLALGPPLEAGDTSASPAEVEPVSAPAPDATAPSPAKPPRIDGTYLGLVLYGGVTLTRVNGLETPGPLSGGGAYVRVGQMVLPWLGLGIQGGGGTGVRSESGARQSVGQGALMVDATFVPLPKRIRGLSLRGSYGFGGGAVRQEGEDGRSGFGGSFFGAGGRYEFFPGAKNYRATRGGGFGIGPELAWLGATPAARGRPMSNTIYLGVSLAFYFGS